MAPAAKPYAIRYQRQLTHRMLGHEFVFAAFLLTQILDGVLTYVGVSIFGLAAEGNPILAWMMSAYGELVALTSAKIVAALCGVALYLLAVDWLLAMLTVVYVGLALVPWTLVLF